VGLTPGRYGTLGAVSNIMIRGSSAEQVLVLIDGRRINDPAMGIVDVGLIPTENIERIEIIRGGASAIYGTSAFGGMVNIITKRPADEALKTELGYSAASFDTHHFRLNFDVKRDRLSGLFTAGRTLSAGWRENSDYSNRTFFTRLGYDAGTWGTFDLSGSSFRSDTGVPGMGVSLDQYDGTREKQASTPDARQTEDRSYIRLEDCKRFDSGDAVKAVCYGSNNDTDYRVPSWAKDDRYASAVFGDELQFMSRFGTTVGMEWWQELYRQTNNVTATTPIDRSRISSAVYLQQELRLGRFGLIPSLRYDDNSSFGGIYSPRITVTLQASDALKLSGNAGKAWRAPTFNELYWARDVNVFWGTTYVTVGNTALKPEEGISSDIGAEYTHRLFKCRATAFLTDSKDLISWQQISDPGTNTVTTIPMNIGKARQTGLELEWSQRIVSGLYHQLNYTYLWAEDRDRKTVLPYRPRHTANYALSFLTARGTCLSADLKYVSPQETGDDFPPVVSALPEYALLGATVTQRFAASAELWFRAENITDKQYQTRLEYPLPGRTFSAGLNIRFWG
jgi:outer membrane cobalamin receptor